MAGHSYLGFYVYELNGLHNCTTFSFAAVGGENGRIWPPISHVESQLPESLKGSSASRASTCTSLAFGKSVLEPPPQNAAIPKDPWSVLNKWLGPQTCPSLAFQYDPRNR